MKKLRHREGSNFLEVIWLGIKESEFQPARFTPELSFIARAVEQIWVDNQAALSPALQTAFTGKLMVTAAATKTWFSLLPQWHPAIRQGQN